MFGLLSSYDRYISENHSGIHEYFSIQKLYQNMILYKYNLKFVLFTIKFMWRTYGPYFVKTPPPSPHTYTIYSSPLQVQWSTYKCSHQGHDSTIHIAKRLYYIKSLIALDQSFNLLCSLHRFFAQISICFAINCIRRVKFKLQPNSIT